MNYINYADHPEMVAVPEWTTKLRMAQFAPTVLVLITVLYPLAAASYLTLIFPVIVAFMTLGLLIYMAIVLTREPKYYNKWAFLSLDIFGTLMWLISFSLLGASAGGGILFYTSCYSYYCFRKRDLEKRYGGYEGIYPSLVCATIIAAAQFVLFVIQLVYFSIALVRHQRKNASPTNLGAKAAVSSGIMAAQPSTIPMTVMMQPTGMQYQVPAVQPVTQPVYYTQAAPAMQNSPYVQYMVPGTVDRGASATPVSEMSATGVSPQQATQVV